MKYESKKTVWKLAKVAAYGAIGAVLSDFIPHFPPSASMALITAVLVAAENWFKHSFAKSR